MSISIATIAEICLLSVSLLQGGQFSTITCYDVDYCDVMLVMTPSTAFFIILKSWENAGECTDLHGWCSRVIDSGRMAECRTFSRLSPWFSWYGKAQELEFARHDVCQWKVRFKIMTQIGKNVVSNMGWPYRWHSIATALSTFLNIIILDYSSNLSPSKRWRRYYMYKYTNHMWHGHGVHHTCV